MEINFTIPGQPQGKARPRMCRVHGKNLTYTPKKTIEYEKLIRASFCAASKENFEKKVPLEVKMLALFSIPESKSNKLKNLMNSGKIWPTKKADCDNIIKVVLDALNGLAYFDDSQVCRVIFEKKYAKMPEIQVAIKNIGGLFDGKSY
jgi:Holliday junction resolvase RusA-like endonuclease